MNAEAPRNPTTELEQAVEEATRALAAATDHPVMRKDPYRLILAALPLVLQAQLQAARAAQPVPATVRADMVQAARDGSAEGLQQGLSRAVGRLVRSADGVRMTIIAGGIGGAFILGMLIGLGTGIRLASSWH